MGNNAFITSLLNKFGTIVVNDALQSYTGIYDFAVRPSQMFGDSVELANLDIIVPEDYDLADTDEFQEGAPPNSATVATVNYKKKFKTSVSTDNIASAIIRGELPQYIALISKRLVDSLIVNKETFMDGILDTFFTANPTFKKSITNFSGGTVREVEVAIKEIIALVASATKPNTDCLKATTGIIPYGEAILAIYASKWADFTVDLRSKLFNPDPTMNAPFKEIHILNDGAFPTDATAFGLLCHPRFLYIIDRLNKFKNRANTENLVDYLKLHYWSRIGVDGGFIGYQLVESA